VAPLLLASCAGRLAPPAAAIPDRPTAAFEVGRDTFAFPNLVRAEHPERTVDFANYCIIMARAANQFFRFARFDPAAPPATDPKSPRLVQSVLDVGPWEAPRPAKQRIAIPGYPDLHAFSAAREPAVKAAFGWSRATIVHWRNWRSVFPLGSEHQ